MYSPYDFHTQKGYELAAKAGITAAMEDYLEMICRLSEKNGYTRIHILSQCLNVKPSSASKMVDNLRTLSLVRSEKYGCITPTESGLAAGNYLLYRHNLLNRFLCRINGSDDELEQVERIEHFIDERTICNIARFLDEK
ncbi:metal-dependent transcriptional regulator [Marasmitruncus massiliensis]|jgi:Mn-dependent DtxR family transcriptional regulator|uniref:metal-dependent transcriptional regulator n=1 Tax=Marasmitruncus massiliensis TaxID=1944642 RepID=UPI000C7CF5BA|nr:metal-dependent transcriptional regulator [Marasmitruncus massiliensis]MBE6905355.1 metal-dependent transcriptional regulator [Oscillospiraceae bacterium]